LGLRRPYGNYDYIKNQVYSAAFHGKDFMKTKINNNYYYNSLCIGKLGFLEEMDPDMTLAYFRPKVNKGPTCL